MSVILVHNFFFHKLLLIYFDLIIYFVTKAKFLVMPHLHYWSTPIASCINIATMLRLAGSQWVVSLTFWIQIRPFNIFM